MLVNGGGVVALPPVGVSLVAENAPQFQRALEAATASVDNFGRTAGGTAATAANTFGKALSSAAGFASNLGGTLKTTLGIFGNFGAGVANIFGPLDSLFTRVFNRFVNTITRQAIVAVERFIGSLAAAAVKGSELETAMGRLDESLKEVSKSAFAPFVDQLGKLVDQAAPAFLGVVQAGEKYLGGLASNALIWGENFIGQFAQGMLNAIGEILSALTSIANLISYYLSPGSPPRILPDLDKWGTSAANEFFGGWAKADFTVFDDLSHTLTALIQSIPVGKADQLSVIPRILGAREGIAAAVEELRTAGTISTATIDRITAAVGTSDASVRAYLVSMVKLQAANANVQAAQDELNKVTATYNELLKPIDAAIAGITESQQQLADAQKKSLLELVLKDPNATANEKRAAQLEIEKIDAEARRRLVVADQKVAVDAAQKKLDAAKEVQTKAQTEYDQKLAIIKLQTDQNNLLKEQLKLLESAAAAAAKPKAGGGAGTPKPFDIKPFDISKLIPPDLLGKWEAFTTAIGNLWDRIKDKFQPTIDAINFDLIPAINNFWGAVKEKIPNVENEFAKTFAFMISQSALVGPTIVTNIATALDNLAAIIRTHGGTIIDATGFIFRAIYTVALAAFNDIIAGITQDIIVLGTVLDVGSLLIQGKFSAIWPRIQSGLEDFFDVGIRTADTDMGLLANLFGLDWTAIKNTISGIWTQINTNLTAAINTVVTIWNTTFMPVLTAFEAYYNQHLAPLLNALANLLDAVVGLALTSLSNKFNDTFMPAITAAHDFIRDNVSPILQKLSDKISVTLQPILETFHGFLTTTLIPQGLTALQTALNGIATVADTLTTAINNVATAIRNLPKPPPWWIGSSPSPFENSLTGISNSMLGVIGNIRTLQAETLRLGGVSPIVSMNRAMSMMPIVVMAGGGSSNTSFNYSPTYNSAPGRVSDNFATMQALWS